MPISFRDATMIPERSPDGAWFEVRIVRADGSKPWPVHGGGLVVVARLVYRAALRSWYVLTRSKKWAVEVLPMDTATTRDRPMVKDVLPTRTDAEICAEEIRMEIRTGRQTW